MDRRRHVDRRRLGGWHSGVLAAVSVPSGGDAARPAGGTPAVRF